MKHANRIYIVIMVVLLILPAAAMPFFRNAANTEKRELAEFPKITADGLVDGSYTRDIESYVTDHIGFRNLLVGANSRIMSGIFRKSAVDRVLLGTDGWLYFAEDLNDYLHISTLSDRGAGNIARTYAIVQEALAQKGVTFVFAPVPNKSTVYDNLPYYYVPLSGDGNLAKVLAACEAEGVRTADLNTLFAKEPETLYQKTDTHWTYKGALLAFREIMRVSGYPYNSFDDAVFETRKDWDGDLAEMLYSEGFEKDEQVYFANELHFEYTSHEKRPNSILLTTYNEAGSGNVLWFRDSYGDTQHVLAAESAETATFSREVPYRMDMVKKYGAELVVLEIVERNLPNLGDAAPVMEAPRTALQASAMPVEQGMITRQTEESQGYLHVYGEIAEKFLGDSYRVMLIANRTDGTQACYEAFPVYERELLGSEESKDNGYSAYLPEDPAQLTSVSVVVESKGKFRYLP